MKNVFIKLVKVIVAIMLVLLIIATIWVFFTGPELPKNTNADIERVMIAELPELVTGETNFVHTENYYIWYEHMMPKDSLRGTILLFMGISNDALGWPSWFLNSLVNSGYQVIRFDYRSTGLSDWIDDYEKEPYSLKDLAHDARLILDTLNVEKAHLVGVSLGGMVAQEFSICFPERSITLTSIMSSGNIVDSKLPGISMLTIASLVKVMMKYSFVKSEKNMIKLNLAARLILKGDANYNIDTKEVSEQVLYNLRKRRGYNSDASAQHQKATLQSGSRYEKLIKSDIPILIIHGEKDPLIPIAHSEKLASLIPNSTFCKFKNLGHDIPNEYVDSIIPVLLKHFNSCR